MRRLWAGIVIALCLALSQQGALLHALGHAFAQAGAQGGVDPGSHPGDAPCGVCLAFAQVASLAAPAFVAPVLLALGDCPPHERTWHCIARRAPPACARGPPRGRFGRALLH